MKAPFSTAQFLQVFVDYNENMYPMQVAFMLMGIVALYFMFARPGKVHFFIGGMLGLLWLWAGTVYHILFFSAINKAAYVFGILFVVQGMLIMYHTFATQRLKFGSVMGPEGSLARFFILFGLIIYPVIGYYIHRSLSMVISAGLPCPTAILTFGFFMLADNRMPRYLFIIPALWSVLGLSAAINFHIYQDFMLIVAALAALAYNFKKSTSIQTKLFN